MKKIGIVTIVDNYNLGNRLQNYAVYRFFKKEYGIKAVTLTSHKNGRFVHGRIFPGLKDSVVVLLSCFPGIVEKRFGPRVNRWLNFIKWNRHIPIIHYYNCSELPERAGEKYDCLFAGSDQIWNYSFSSDKFYNYFLMFTDSNKRAAISASFGVEEIPDEWTQCYKDGLSGMKYISVREDAGAKIVKEITGRTVPVLIDPVMMLNREEWLAVAAKPRIDCSVPYVLKYYLGDDDDKKINRWAEENGYRVYDLMKKDNLELYSTGPGEFLKLIDHAALICSDSFHCIVLSILMKRPFIVYERKGKLNNISSRMDTLLNKFGFQGRRDTLLREADYLKCDFSELDICLEVERQKFRKYIAMVMNGEDPFLPHLADENTCTGCTACANICPKHCIEMKPDENGFLYPVIDSTICINCGTCEKICPVLNNATRNGIQPKAYAAYSLDEAIRMKSSSGGVFSEIAKAVLAKGGAVYGAVYDRNFNVHHCVVENLAKLERLQGAKYAESVLGNVFSDIRERLDDGQQVLFSGTPCQIVGLKAFLKKDYDNLLTVDFVCHGVPSPMVWEKYVRYRAEIDNEGRLPTEINLRDKSSGWSHYRYSNTFKYDDNKERQDVSNQSMYMKFFTNDYISRLSCGNCKFKGYSHSSDITLGDFWGIWDIDPEMDDDRGTSVVMIQSEKGQHIWNNIKDHIRFKSVQLEQASRQNPSMVYSSKMKDERAKVLKSIRAVGFEKTYLSLFQSAQIWTRLRKIYRYKNEKKTHY